MTTDLHDVRNWLAEVVVKVAPSAKEETIDAYLANFAPDLARDFPPQVFAMRAGTAGALARECAVLPNDYKIATFLRAWLAEHAPLRLAGAQSGPKGEVKRWTDYFARRTSERFQDQDGSPPANLAAARENCLSLVEAQCPEAYRLITRQPYAPNEGVESWGNEEAVRETIQRLDYDEHGVQSPHPMRERLLSVLTTALEMHAPQHLHLLPAGGARRDRPVLQPLRGVDNAQPARRAPDEQIAAVKESVVVRGPADDLAYAGMLRDRCKGTGLPREQRDRMLAAATMIETRINGVSGEPEAEGAAREAPPRPNLRPIDGGKA